MGIILLINILYDMQISIQHSDKASLEEPFSRQKFMWAFKINLDYVHIVHIGNRFSPNSQIKDKRIHLI